MSRHCFAALTVALMVLWAPATGRASDPPCHAAPAAGPREPKRTVEHYEAPDVTLLSQDREAVRLRDLLTWDRPVLVQFIYATCTTVCPPLSVAFASLQRSLGPEASRVRLVSITIDPENDGPEVARRYLKRFRAGPGWTFLTGSREDIEVAMRAFDAFVPDKMSHRPLTFLRSPRDGRWIRHEGLPDGATLMKEVRELEAESMLARRAQPAGR